VRELSQNDFGEWNLYLNTFRFLVAFSAMGFPSLIQRFIPEFESTNNYRNIRITLIISFSFRLTLSIVLFTILYLWRDNIEELFKLQGLSDYLAIVLLIIIIRTLNSNSVSILNALIMHMHRNTIQLFGYIIQVVLFIYVIDNGLGIYGLLVAYLIASTLITVAYSIIFISKYIRLKGEIKNKYPKKDVVRYGFFGLLREFGDIVFSNISDLYIIGIFLDPVAVAIYALSIKISGIASSLLPINMGRDAITPVYFKKYEKNKNDKYLFRGFHLFNKVIAFFVFPMVAYFMVYSDYAILLVYGEEYIESSTLLIILVIFSGFGRFALSTGFVMLALKHIEISFYSRIFIFYNVGMSILLIERFGLPGVAIATGTAILFKNILIFILLRRYIDLKYNLESFIKPLFNSIILGFILFLIKPIVDNLIVFIIVSIASPVIYLFISFFNKTFNPTERNIINSNINKNFVRF